jgi:hypothetical protein
MCCSWPALLAVGVALVLGIGMRVAAAAGALLTVMIWTAVLPPASNPFMDDHLIYAAMLIVLALLGGRQHPGPGPCVGRHPAGPTRHLAEVGTPFARPRRRNVVPLGTMHDWYG